MPVYLPSKYAQGSVERKKQHSLVPHALIVLYEILTIAEIKTAKIVPIAIKKIQNEVLLIQTTIRMSSLIITV